MKPSRPVYQSPYSREVLDLARLREILMARRGERNAIRAKDLALLLGLGRRDRYPERSIREAVNELSAQGLPVGSSVHDPPGYFVVETEAELQRCVANYLARARENQRKAERLIDAFRHGPRQPILPATEPAGG